MVLVSCYFFTGVRLQQDVCPLSVYWWHVPTLLKKQGAWSLNVGLSIFVRFIILAGIYMVEMNYSKSFNKTT